MMRFWNHRTRVIRVRAGEQVRLRIEAEGVAFVEGDAAKLARELYEGGYQRLLRSKEGERRRQFVAGVSA